MVEFVSIAAAREWLRLESEDATDDLIKELLESATQRVFGFLGVPMEGAGSWTVDDVPPSIKTAIKTVAASLFDNRGAFVLTDDDLRSMLPDLVRISFA